MSVGFETSPSFISRLCRVVLKTKESNLSQAAFSPWPRTVSCFHYKSAQTMFSSDFPQEYGLKDSTKNIRFTVEFL